MKGLIFRCALVNRKYKNLDTFIHLFIYLINLFYSFIFHIICDTPIFLYIQVQISVFLFLAI